MKKDDIEECSDSDEEEYKDHEDSDDDSTSFSTQEDVEDHDVDVELKTLDLSPIEQRLCRSLLQTSFVTMLPLLTFCLFSLKS